MDNALPHFGMKLLMISGDRSILQGKKGAFWYTLHEFRKYWDRIDIITPHVSDVSVDFLSPTGHNLPAEGEGGEVHFHPCPRGLWYQPHWIVKKGKQLHKEHGHGVMTVHEYPPFYNGKGAKKLSRKIGIPYALEVHHIIGYPKPASLFESIGYRMSRIYLPWEARRTSAIRVVNQTVKDVLVKWGIPEEKVHIVSSFYLDATLLKKQISPPVAYDVVFCARLVPNKGLREVIQAVQMMPHVRLLIIGDGPEKKACEKMVTVAGMKHRVTFAGWLSTQEAVVGALQSARIFVMNSKSEGGPRIALEAMAVGMPTIATPVGVMPEVIEDGVNGLFTNGSPNDLAEKIQYLLAHEEKRLAMGKEAMEVLTMFNGKELVRRYANFLWSLT